jgi:hypothetical protein
MSHAMAGIDLARTRTDLYGQASRQIRQELASRVLELPGSSIVNLFLPDRRCPSDRENALGTVDHLEFSTAHQVPLPAGSSSNALMHASI